MRNTVTSVLGDKRVNYPDKRKPAERSVYPWMNRPFGRVAKILVMLIAQETLDIGETSTRKYKESGLDKEDLYRKLLFYLPWLPKEHLQVTGTELTSDKVRQRFYMMHLKGTRKHESRAVSQSDEHPLNNKVLRPMVPFVEKLYKLRKPITKGQVLAIDRHRGGR